MRTRVGVPLALLLALATACGTQPPPAAPASPAAPATTPTTTPEGAPAPPASPVRVRVTVRPGMNGAPFEVPRSLTVPAGWTASVFARIAKARFLAQLPDGGLLVSQPSGGRVFLVRGEGQVREFIGGLDRPHDMVLAEVGGRRWLYIAEADRVVRYPYTPGATRATGGQAVVGPLPDESLPELHGSYGHVLKNIAVHDGTLYVSIASSCNACVEDTQSNPLRGAIYRYDAAGRNAGRQLVARGVRNAEGLAIAPGTDDLWAVVNNRDNLLVPDNRDVDGDGRGDRGELLGGYLDNHPPELFINVRSGGFYGWPFCNPSPDKGLRDMPYDRDFELNRDGRRADCARATPVDVGIQAHSAPLGLTFTQGTTAPDLGAVIPLHGSWNRTKRTGYKIINFPWTDDGPGEQRDLVTGWLDEASGQVWGRPVDVAVGPDGSLLVSDDAGGAVLKLSPPT
jgi:glucose/arabinose dehydrogenase